MPATAPTGAPIKPPRQVVAITGHLRCGSKKSACEEPANGADDGAGDDA
jgi:hypothetical protein